MLAEAPLGLVEHDHGPIPNLLQDRPSHKVSIVLHRPVVRIAVAQRVPQAVRGDRPLHRLGVQGLRSAEPAHAADARHGLDGLGRIAQLLLKLACRHLVEVELLVGRHVIAELVSLVNERHRLGLDTYEVLGAHEKSAPRVVLF